MGLYRGHLLFFFECVYLSLLYPSLMFDTFCHSVCVLEWFWISLTVIFPLGGASGVMVIVVGNGHGDTSSNPGRD